jgi:putative transposase
MTAPRRHRRNSNDPGHAHELTFSCYKRFHFLRLRAERICHWLSESISEARNRWDLDLWAYVFMPEHVHMIVHPRKISSEIAAIRRAIKAPVGSRAMSFLEEHHPEWLPRLTRRRGRKTERLFWQSGGGYDRNVVEPATLMSMIDYIHGNPVRRGLVERPEQWRWSSAAWCSGVGESPLVPDRIPPEWVP